MSYTVPAGTYIWPVYGVLIEGKTPDLESSITPKFASKKIMSNKDFLFDKSDIVQIPNVKAFSRFNSSSWGNYAIIKFDKYAKISDRTDAVGFIVNLSRCASNDVASIDDLIGLNPLPIPSVPRTSTTTSIQSQDVDTLRTHTENLFSFLKKNFPHLNLSGLNIKLSDNMDREVFSYNIEVTEQVFNVKSNPN